MDEKEIERSFKEVAEMCGVTVEELRLGLEFIIRRAETNSEIQTLLNAIPHKGHKPTSEVIDFYHLYYQ